MHLQDGIRGRGLRDLSKASKLTLVGTAALVVAACGSTSTGGSSSPAVSNPGVPSGISVSSFTTDIASTMGQLKSLTAYATKGANSLLIGVILPDTTSSVRWVDFDQPYINAALADAGFTQSQYRIDNAQGSDGTELDDATADINLGAKVLIMCPLDGPTGQAIAQLAESKGVTLISYDRATFQGSRPTTSASTTKLSASSSATASFPASPRGGSRSRRCSCSTAVRTPTRTRSRSRTATTR